MLRSIDIEKEITDFLVSNDIYPFSVLYISNPKILKISFYLPGDIKELLDLINYSKMCDNSGVTIFEDTVLLSGSGLLNFFRYVGDNKNT